MLAHCQMDLWKQISVNLNQNMTIFIQENEFQNIVFKLAAILPHSNMLTHLPQCRIYSLTNWLITASSNGSPPSHYLNQCWCIVNYTLRNKFQWNFNRNSNIIIQEKVFEKCCLPKWWPLCPGGDELMPYDYRPPLDRSQSPRVCLKLFLSFTIYPTDKRILRSTQTHNYHLSWELHIQTDLWYVN